MRFDVKLNVFRIRTIAISKHDWTTQCEFGRSRNGRRRVGKDRDRLKRVALLYGRTIQLMDKKMESRAVWELASRKVK